jgi:hypothetical protein
MYDNTVKTDNYHIEIIHPAMIESKWEEMLPHLMRVVEVSNNEFTEETIRQKAFNGNSLLVAIYENKQIIAVTTAEIVTYDSGLRSLLIPIFGGNKLVEWGDEWLEMMKHLAKHFNCTELRGLAVRDGWLRLLQTRGFNEVHTVITCKLH